MPTLCGCYHTVDTSASADDLSNGPDNLPLLSSNAHATILSTTTRTKLRQTFCNPSPTNLIKECAYVFPVYDGVSVVGFTCHVGSCTIHGIVKEKNTAKAVYDDAVARGETAGLLAQEWDASDVFSAKIGSIPANETVTVEITYIGELEHDIGSDAIRYSLPTKIMPRYGSKPTTSDTVGSLVPSSIRKGGIQITVDVNMADGAHIEEIKSTTYDAIEISFPTPLTALDVPHTVHEASVKLSIDKASLEKDFILLVKTKDPTVPKAILESHPTIQGQRALIVTLVPRFTLPTPSSEDLPTTPSEIIFVVDRSGSMENWMPTLISAMKVSLKSLKEGVRFNICSFGTNHSFLWSESRPKVRDTLKEALIHVESFRADMYGTEMHSAIEATFRKLTGDHPCEIMLFTDGECWDSDSLCKYISHEVGVSKGNIRLFSLGIGKSVSSALIHGVARAGNGFAQNVDTEANMDTKVIRMLKGAMSPHVTDYSLQVKYAEDCGDEFELVNSCTRSIEFEAWEPINSEEVKTQKNNTPSIPIFDKNVHPDNEEFATASERDSKDRPGVSLKLPPPELLQAPSNIPPLFSFLRTTVYVLMSPQTSHKNPTSIVLKGSLKGQSLEQEIPIEILPEAGETLHQLAAKKAIQELEQGRGWIYDAKHKFEEFLEGSLKDQTSSRFEQKVEEEAVRLGVLFQVAGKWCSFVAVSSNDDNQETVVDDSSVFDDLSVRELTLESPDLSSGRILMSRDPYVYAPPPGSMRGHLMIQTSSVEFDKDDDSNSCGFSLSNDSFSCSFSGGNDHVSSREKGFSGGDDYVSEASLSIKDRLYRIISLQDFEGWWQSSPELISLLDIDKDISEALGAAGADRKCATDLVIKFLETRMLEEKEVWELVVETAKEWLKKEG